MRKITLSLGAIVLSAGFLFAAPAQAQSPYDEEPSARTARLLSTVLAATLDYLSAQPQVHYHWGYPSPPPPVVYTYPPHAPKVLKRGRVVRKIERRYDLDVRSISLVDGRYRAVARDHRGRRVVVVVDAYTGRVLKKKYRRG